LLYLAGAGVGRLGIVDGDVVEAGNLHRQVIHDTPRLGVNKALSAKWSVQRLNPHVDVIAYPFRIVPENALRLVSTFDVVVDATDNVSARYLLSDSCVIAGKPLISAAALRTDGQVSVYCHHGGPCYRCVHPFPPPPDTVLKADAAGVLGPLVGVVACVQAIETIKVLADIGKPLDSRMLFVDGLGATTRVAKIRGKQASCAACGPQATIKDPSTFNYIEFCGSASIPTENECKEFGIGCQEFKQMLDSVGGSAEFAIIDARSASEVTFSPFGHGAMSIPFAMIQEQPGEVVKAVMGKTNVVVLCRKGTDSFRAAKQLKQYGIDGSRFLIGGLLAWAETIDKQYPIY
jgi:adenylyltransferase/sulfurtransferase